MRLGLLALLLFACLAAPASAAASLIAPAGSFGSGARPAAGFADAAGIAVDDAGRVYVADAAAGRVEVFDSAPAGNRYLLSIGEGKLVRPVAVAVDNRNRIYVADAGRHVVELYDSASRRFAPRGTLGERGQAIGQFDQPSGLATDPGQRLLVTEQGNLRVSIFRPARGGGIVFQTAFGIALPEPFLRPTATARDSDGRVYIANSDSDGGQVRAFDRRGRFISVVGGLPVRAPRGVAVDRFERVVIADTGGGRLIVYGPLQRGASLLESFASPDLGNPGALAFAPGSLIYVLSAGRVVRLRFDDLDLDGVADLGDNCQGLANPLQTNSDSDPAGDACDGDDDADGRADGDDRCPTEAARRDADGCRDPLSRFMVPIHNRRYPVSPGRLTGRSEGGVLGVERVDVAIGRRLDAQHPTSSRARCSWLNPRARRFTERPCSRPVWFTASGRDSWRVRLRAGMLGNGRYVVRARAQQRSGPLESGRVLGRNVRLFTVS